MKKVYRHLEHAFERLTSSATNILGNSITFIIAFILVLVWLFDKRFFIEDIHSKIADIILGVAFLNLFIIQKSFNRFSASLHLKVNELVASHEKASNTVINAESATDDEITILAREYIELAVIAQEERDAKSDNSPPDIVEVAEKKSNI